MSLYVDIQTFLNEWLFAGVNPHDIIFTIGGDLFNLAFSTDTLINVLTVIFIIICLWFAYYTVKWLVNFIFSLGGGVK